MELFWLIAILVGVVVGALIIAAALRGMRPRMPEAQTFTPVPVIRSGSGTATNTTPAGTSPEVIAEIDRLVALGQRSKAIKVLRTHAKIGAKEAKDRIAHWSISTTPRHAAAVSHAEPARSSAPPTRAASPTRASLPASVAAEVDRLLAAGDPVTAIRTVRAHTRLGLREAKDLIDAWTPPHRR
ncbi:hypothetical protein [Microbacterium sp.]|uniref:hypothetical protein n=1 Tax=Microbacterium sp. TaxID=51671 RepID=UPI0028111BA2|nr:hypothetical protein [Microbacterium sp.]